VPSPISVAEKQGACGEGHVVGQEKLKKIFTIFARAKWPRYNRKFDFLKNSKVFIMQLLIREASKYIFKCSRFLFIQNDSDVPFKK
jgi:hypothetical protein